MFILSGCLMVSRTIHIPKPWRGEKVSGLPPLDAFEGFLYRLPKC
jgi:hypothetical protein